MVIHFFFNKIKRLYTYDLTKKIGTNLIIKLIGLFLGYLNILIISNWYGVSSYGIFTLCFTIISIAQVLPKFGMETSVLRIINDFEHSKTSEIRNIILKVVSVALLLGVISSIILYYVAPFIAIFFNKDLLTGNIQTISYVLIPFSFIFLFGGILQALNFSKEHIFLKTGLLHLLFFVLLLLNLVLDLKLGIISIYAYSVIIGFVFAMVLLINRFNSKGISFKKEESKYEGTSYNKIIKTSFPMLLATSIFLVMGWTDILMLGYFMDEKQVGVFNASLRLSTLAGISLGVVNSIVTPKFAVLFVADKKEELKKLVKKSTKLIFYLSTPFLVIFLLFPKTILSMFGSEFINGSGTLMILTIGQVVSAVCGSVGLLMMMTNQQKLNKNIIIIATILNAILNYCLIPLYGILGAAIANMCSLIFWNLLMVVAVRRNLGFWTFYLPFSKTN